MYIFDRPVQDQKPEASLKSLHPCSLHCVYCKNVGPFERCLGVIWQLEKRKRNLTWFLVKMLLNELVGTKLKGKFTVCQHYCEEMLYNCREVHVQVGHG